MTSEMAAWTHATPSEAPRKASSRPVDLVHLSRYTLGDRALEREVLELFSLKPRSISNGCATPHPTWNGNTPPIR